MYKIINHKTIKLFMLAMIAILLIVGCSAFEDDFEAENTGQLKIATNLPGSEEQAIVEDILDDIDLDKIVVQISNEDYNDIEEVDFNEDEKIVFDELPVGDYEVTVQAIELEDENEYIIYEGSEEISIKADTTTEKTIELKINTATVTVVFPEIEDYREEDEDVKLSLEKPFSDSIEKAFEEDDGEEWRVEITELQAERWDVKLKNDAGIIASQDDYEFLPGREYHLFVEVDGDDLIIESAMDLELSYPDLSEVEINETMMQTFYWEMNENVESEEGTEINYADDYPEEAELWNLLADRADKLSEIGFTSLWLPPASKGTAFDDPADEDVGYSVYDFWDLGEFEQHDSKRTKYGTKEELMEALDSIHDAEMEAYFDVVFNHRMGAAYTEEVNLAGGGDIEAWTGFEGNHDGADYSFAGRDEYYTEDKWADLWHDFKWNQNEYGVFTAVDYDAREDAEGEFLFENKEWGQTFDNDYLMGANVDYYSGDWKNEKVIDEMKAWGEWVVNEIGFDGFRMDATAHVDNRFISEWVEHVQAESNEDLFFVAEAWVDDVAGYLQAVDEAAESDELYYFKAFDFGLRNLFAQLRDGNLDLSELENAGLNGYGFGDKSVTFLDNHDTNRDEENDYNQTSINNRANQAYAYILTRKHSIPTVFWKDYYQYEMSDTLDKLISARKHFAYGEAYEYDGNTDGVYVYTRAGLDEVEGTGLVMLISDYEDGDQAVMSDVYSGRANTTYIDYTGNVDGVVETDNEGDGDFKVNPDSWSVWVPVDYNDWSDTSIE